MGVMTSMISMLPQSGHFAGHHCSRFEKKSRLILHPFTGYDLLADDLIMLSSNIPQSFFQKGTASA
jgi:hypothetical protein